MFTCLLFTCLHWKCKYSYPEAHYEVIVTHHGDCYAVSLLRSIKRIDSHIHRLCNMLLLMCRIPLDVVPGTIVHDTIIEHNALRARYRQNTCSCYTVVATV